MPKIELETIIHTDLKTCFDLSRSIDLHLLSTAQTREKAIAGKTSGLIGADEFVTWEASHFGIRQKLTTRITAFDPPFYFRDEQMKGIFKYFVHDHHFEQQNDGVLMRDVFDFRSPFGLIGVCFDKLILTRYMTRFLKVRNQLIKEFAETDQWKLIYQ